MHEDYAELATELIAENGRPMLLVREGVTSQLDPRNSTKEVAKVIGFQADFKTAEIDGDLIAVGDKKILIDSFVEVETTMGVRDFKGTFNHDDFPLGQWVEDTGVVGEPLDYSIIDRLKTRPGETTIMYQVQARL